MVHWTDGERKEIDVQWKKQNMTALVKEGLERMFCVYPWTKRYFENRKNFTVAGHAKTVSDALEKAVKNMDNVKAQFTEISKTHAEVLHVDSGSFHLLTDCVIIAMASNRKPDFSPEVHSIWDKFFKVVVDAISKQYH
ncbi:hemoglobin subunit beta-like [Stegostoma tigrinum]|uniref:hemoglobin subunit beta-like n=1 Tax=Stegostoma tigrinum TaxID=3053191 RepID=UPI00202B8055|nr:hemoglobin subunit beta-like [Stegostoma tigrinum]